jgi:thiol-disulfide isomerase/thioredoxin
MNQSLLSIEKGEYHVVHKSKSFLKSDTNIHAARVRYFKTDGGPGDTLARFVLWPAGKDLMQGSDGEVYFYIGKDSAIAIERVRQKKGLIAYVSRGNGFRAGVLSLPILTNRGHIPVDPESWSAARVGRFVWNDTAFIELYRRRMFPIHMKITPTAKDSMIYTEQWLLYPDTYTPRRICAWADQQDGHVQYDAYDYSPIRLLSPESTFEETYNVAQLLKNGYHVVDIDPQAHKKRVRLALGDSIPDFAVRLETGETLPLFSAFTQRYLVLDFWYRSCGPCNLAMPGLDRTAKALAGKDVAIVGINPIDKQYDALIQQYKRQYGYTFAIAFTERAAAERMRISAYPQIMVVDRETRRVIYLESGYSEAGENQLRERLEILLR